MGMKNLHQAIARIALEVHPDRIDALCATLESPGVTNSLASVKGVLGNAFSPGLIAGLADALDGNPKLTAEALAAMFRASSATAALAAGASSVELVWTGPSTSLVPVRHTAQVLTGLIDEACERLFLVSFVAYHVDSVLDALQRAIQRKVQVRVLLEQSKEHGGHVTVDSIAMLKQALPRAQILEWNRKDSEAARSGAVHAKCAVADGLIAFVTSANLSDAAMERNMELGILLRGGQVPSTLDRHLAALVMTKQVRAL